MRKFIKSIFRLGSIAVVSLLAISYWSAYIEPSTFWPLYFLGLAFPWLLLANLIFFLFWAFLKKWYALLPLLCILIGWGHVTTFVGMKPGSKEGALRVMTYNIGLKKKMSYKATQSLEEKMSRLFLDNENDIVCLQECTPSESHFQTTINAAKTKGFPFYHRIPSTALTIFSRYPIEKKGALPFHGKGNGGIFADIKVRDKKIRVYNLHLASNHVTVQTNNLIESGNLQKRSTWESIKLVFLRVKDKAIFREKLSAEIKKEVEASPYPAIVCGDFNEPNVSYTYQTIKGKRQAAFQAGGFGLGSTYAGAIPALKIDHILVDEKLKVLDAAVVKTDLGDHYPLVTEIDW